jgi:hypothetical protein
MLQMLRLQVARSAGALLLWMWFGRCCFVIYLDVCKQRKRLLMCFVMHAVLSV